MVSQKKDQDDDQEHADNSTGTMAPASSSGQRPDEQKYE